MFLVSSIEDAADVIRSIYADRLGQGTGAVGSVRGPVGLFLVRDDGADGSELAREVVGSLQYWHVRTGHWFDGFFLGWGYDEKPVFSADAFVGCVQDLEARLKWTYKGGAELLLTEFFYDLASQSGEFDFSRTIPLDLSKLLSEKKLRHLSPLIEELVAPARKAVAFGEASVCDASDYIALLRTREFFWKRFIERVGALLGWADVVAPYAVRDLRRTR